MLESLTREKVYETIDLDKKNQLQQLFYDFKIDYVVRKKDVHHRSSLDTIKMGEMMVKSKYVYEFWVKKNQIAEAQRHVRVLK